LRNVHHLLIALVLRPLAALLIIGLSATVAQAQGTPTPAAEEEAATATPTAAVLSPLATATTDVVATEAVTATQITEPLTEINGCADLPAYTALRSALQEVVTAGDNGGFGNEMWATLVDRTGIICVVTYSGADQGEQWPGSRIIAAQKANTVNAFGLPDLAISTANLYAGTQPGGSLYGLLDSLPVYAAVAYAGPAENYGTVDDPLIGLRMGGVSVFGGGLALYGADGTLVGGLGLSGDSSCTDHIIAWKVRDALGLDYVPAGVTEANNDNIVFDIEVSEAGLETSASGWGHPECGLGEVEIAAALPENHPLGDATASYPMGQLLVDATWLSADLKRTEATVTRSK
jgi:uncharacterized protein GlcG (DUF336 family)